MEVHDVARTILEQLGGRKFLTMTGSYNLQFSSTEKNYLSMHLRPNRLGAKYLKITLTAMDDYTLTFSKMVGKGLSEKHVIIKEIPGVYCDQLEEIFTRETGLYTRLF